MSSQGKLDIVIIDETEPCPYLSDEIARMPLRMPLTRMTRQLTDQRFAEGNRRTGEFIYKTNCPTCTACEPIRIECDQFVFSRNHRRVLSRGDRKFSRKVGKLSCDEARVKLFNKHRAMRGLARKDAEIDHDEYVWGFVRTCFESFEITYYLDGELVCVAICDHGEYSLSAVYTFFDPELRHDSLGTYSILKQIEYCQESELRYLYLGYYVENSPHMQYKSRFVPNQRLINGQWQDFE